MSHQVGRHGQPKVVLSLASAPSTTAEIYTLGATLTSWAVDGAEQLFLSAEARFDGASPIRGGIPVVFPQFGLTGPLKQHGFARTSLWRLERHEQGTDATTAVFVLEDTDATRAEWPHAFRLEYTVVLSARSLRTALHVVNRGSDQAFSFTTALHTYFAVRRIEDVRVVGLKGLRYTDKMLNAAQFDEEREALTVAEETDRVYHRLPSQARILLHDGSARTVAVDNEAGFTDSVVFNPWIVKSKALADFGDEEYHVTIAIELAAIEAPVVVAPGASWTGAQTFSLLS